MSLTLADRLSSPRAQEFTRLSRPSSTSTPEFGEDSRTRCHRRNLIRRVFDPAPIEPKPRCHKRLHRQRPNQAFRQPIPDTHPLDNTQQVAQRTLPYNHPQSPVRVPLIERISVTAKKPAFDTFRKGNDVDIVAILSSKLNATIIRYQAIIDKKYLINELPPDWQHAIYDTGRRLNWAADNVSSAPSWSFTQRRDVDTVCTLIGGIKFHEAHQCLEQRFYVVAKQLYQRVYQGNFLAWIDVTKRFGDV